MNYLEDTKEIPQHRDDSLTDMKSAMDTTEITDFTSVPFSRYNDWKILLKMNDSQGHWHNFLSPLQRLSLVNNIAKYKKAHYLH